MYKNLIFIVAIFIFRMGDLNPLTPVNEKLSIATDRDIYYAGNWHYLSQIITIDPVHRNGFIYVAKPVNNE